MSLYERHVLPWVIDKACGHPAMREQRARLVPAAAGTVLEIGIGSGRNLRHYDAARIDRLYGLDPSAELLAMAQRRAGRAGLAFEELRHDAAAIPLDAASVDCVLVTYTLCSIPDIATALGEMRRVLRPGGRVLFSEHGAAPDAGVRRWQDRLNPLWRPLAGGCNLNRDIPALLRQAGFALERLDAGYLDGPPRLLGYNFAGVAKVG
jgi:ubiquinone/menaquinone biosynthesis C-methylase UbiE